MCDSIFNLPNLATNLNSAYTAHCSVMPNSQTSLLAPFLSTPMELHRATVGKSSHVIHILIAATRAERRTRRSSCRHSEANICTIHRAASQHYCDLSVHYKSLPHLPSLSFSPLQLRRVLFYGNVHCPSLTTCRYPLMVMHPGRGRPDWIFRGPDSHAA